MARDLDTDNVRRALAAAGELQDELTRLPNRRAFRLLARHEQQLAERHHRAFTIFATAVEHDLAADGEGREHDWVRIAVAELLRETFRESDVIARLDSDLFAVLAAETPEDGAERVIVRLHEGLAVHPAVAARSGHVGLRVGAAGFERGSTADELLERAMQRMQAAA
jgi:diguanylate cyclase (GGDEF)-like protein